MKKILKRTAKEILTNLLYEFPGLLNGEDDVNGGDLVDALSYNLIEWDGRDECLKGLELDERWDG